MPRHIPAPTRVTAAGTPPKQIDEYVGLVNSLTDDISIAHMRSPAGWGEPAQRPEFEEITLVLQGHVVVEHDHGTFVVRAGEAVIASPGERVRYSTPEGAEYIAVCRPAFSPSSVHRES